MNKQFWRHNAPTILTYLGGIGLIATAVMSAKATTKAIERIKEVEEEKGGELSKWELTKSAAPAYIPALLLGTGTLACIFGANLLNKKHQASLISAYTLLDRSYKQYQHKLIELYGEDTHQDVLGAIAIENAKEVGISAPGICSNSTLYLDEESCGETRLFYEGFGQRYFESTLEQVISAEYHLNRNYTLRGSATVNELYEFLGLEPFDGGDDLGWETSSGIYWVDFDHRKVTTEKGLECYAIHMPFGPSLEWEEYEAFF